MKKIWILAMMVLLAACKQVEEGASTWPMAPQSIEVAKMIRNGQLQYAQDPNTGMCFAYGWMHRCCGNAATGGPIVTWVPCDSLQVEAPK